MNEIKYTAGEICKGELKKKDVWKFIKTKSWVKRCIHLSIKEEGRSMRICKWEYSHFEGKW